MFILLPIALALLAFSPGVARADDGERGISLESLLDRLGEGVAEADDARSTPGRDRRVCVIGDRELVLDAMLLDAEEEANARRQMEEWLAALAASTDGEQPIRGGSLITAVAISDDWHSVEVSEPGSTQFRLVSIHRTAPCLLLIDAVACDRTVVVTALRRHLYEASRPLVSAVATVAASSR